MDAFYPVDDLEMAMQLAAFFLWAFAARLGWRWADFLLAKIRELFVLLFTQKKGSP